MKKDKKDRPNAGGVHRSCPKCSGKLVLKKISSGMRFGSCETCGRTYALK